MMPEKITVLQRIISNGVIAVVRAENSQKALLIADAVKKGGINTIEITMTVPGAIDVIKELTNHYSKDELLIGAGTVLDGETARLTILAGAQFIVSPCLNLNVIRTANRYQKVVMPGAMTVRDVVEGLEAGADVIKIFPGEILGPGIIKAIRGPIPYAPLIPTGGVSIDNVDKWISAGALAVGVGGALTKSAEIGDYETITALAKEFVKKVQKARA
ncbi:MAG: ketohydroxyglutarate aldolase [Desulfitibacter sp. BRH_c19]|nr:MAG: ketohydroxyglutarate aldolase [Desulfitibacter sp. BRH_c19]